MTAKLPGKIVREAIIMGAKGSFVVMVLEAGGK